MAKKHRAKATAAARQVWAVLLDSMVVSFLEMTCDRAERGAGCKTPCAPESGNKKAAHGVSRTERALPEEVHMGHKRARACS